MKDLRGKRPIDTYPILVTIEDGYLFDGSGSAVINVNITASQAISASYEIIYETSSSYAETASLAGTSSFAITSSFSQTSSFAVTASTALHLIVSESIVPNADAVYNLGASDYVFINAYANNFIGNASTADSSISASYSKTASFSFQANTSSFPWRQTGNDIAYSLGYVTASIYAPNTMIIPVISGSPVITPIMGMMTFDSSSNLLYVYDGASWRSSSFA